MTSLEWQNWFKRQIESPHPNLRELTLRWYEAPPVVLHFWLRDHPSQLGSAQRLLRAGERFLGAQKSDELVLFKKWRALILGDLPRTLKPSRDDRESVLRELLRSRERITVDDYLEALGPTVSRRVAQLDLQTFPFLKKRGKTQARFYVRAPAPRGLRR